MQARPTPPDTPATPGAVPASGDRAWLALAAVGGIAALTPPDERTPCPAASAVATLAPVLDTAP